jgi:hydroxymethylpyrimidine/phosphomethylpyrimidine kinase
VGGAGIQADIEAIVANGGQAATAITCLTVQDTIDVWSLQPVEPGLLEEQVRAVLNDLPVAVIKIGLTGSEGIVATIADLLQEFPRIPVILDPVLAAGGGMELAGRALVDIICDQLLPRVNLITPNSLEARRLAEEEELELCGQRLLALGCESVLITGTHEKGAEVENRLYTMDGSIHNWSWPRLEDSYHGSGCTLASAIATLFARGIPLLEALEQAQAYTWKSLYHARRPGQGQALPDRLHLLLNDDPS